MTATRACPSTLQAKEGDKEWTVSSRTSFLPFPACRQPGSMLDYHVTPAARPLSNLAGIIAAGAVVLLIHRYPGINHDASIYFGLVLHQLQPGIFDHDLFFAYGSQDSFTVLPWLLAQAAKHAALPDIFLAGALLGLMLFAWAAWFMLVPLMQPRARSYAWIGVIALPGMYSVLRVFTYGEPFLTARPLAEAISLFGLGFLARHRLLPAALCLIAAGLLHPLQTIGAMLIAWAWMILLDRRWLQLAWLGVPVLLLGFTAIKPFDGLYRVIDPAWRTDLSDFTLQLFITEWYPADWAMLVRDLMLLSYASWRFRDAFGRWCLAGLAGLLLGVLASLLLADLLHLALPTALQLWRTHWLAHLLANAATGVLLYWDLSTRNWIRASVLALAIVMIAGGFLWSWIPVLATYMAWPALSPRMTPGFRRALGALASLCMLGLLVAFAAEEWLPFRLAHYRFDLYAIDRRLLAFPMGGFALCLLGLWLWSRSGSFWQRMTLLVMATSLMLIGAWRWDARSPIARALESASFNPALFGPRLPERAQIFWAPPMYPAVWVTLGRIDYFSPWQLAGSVFNRGTPREGRLRLERMRPVIEEDMYCQDRSVPARERASCRISNATLYQACRPGHSPPPDYLVLPYRQDSPTLGEWRILDPATRTVATTFWLYACPAVLKSLSVQPDTARSPQA